MTFYPNTPSHKGPTFAIPVHVNPLSMSVELFKGQVYRVRIALALLSYLHVRTWEVGFFVSFFVPVVHITNVLYC